MSRRRVPMGLLALTTVLGTVLAGAPVARAARPSITEFAVPTAAARPYAIAAGPDGALWFTEADADRIGRIDTAGHIQEFPLTAGSEPFGITAGPDGALWFTEFSRDRIGRITITGQITEFQLSPGASPFRIVAGPDGNLWFTEMRLNRVGSISTTGQWIETPLPLPFDTAQDITVGPDGNLWVTEFPDPNGGNFGGLIKVGTDGTMTAFETAVIALPFGIATGSDGQLWVTDPGINHVASFDPITHAIRTFTVPGGILNSPYFAVNGPDGALWFTESGSSEAANVGGNKIGRINLATRRLQQLPVPTMGSAPSGIAVGPDGAIWFTEAQGNKIGRVSLSG